jgi:Flp pilus assembly pilin Flp
MLRAADQYRGTGAASHRGATPARAASGRGGANVKRFLRFTRADDGLATIEYIIGAAVVLGTLVVGVQTWNNGLVTRLQSLVTQMAAVR